MRPFILLIMLMMSCSFIGCGGGGDENEPAKNNATEDPLAALSPIETNRFAERISEAIETKDKGRFVKLFSKRLIFKAVFSGLDIRTGTQRELESAINRGGNFGNLFNEITDGIARGGSYDFVSKRLPGFSSDAILFRLRVPGGRNLIYHQYQLERGDKSRLFCTDVFFHLSGISLVDRLRESVLELLKEKDLIDPTQMQQLVESIASAEPSDQETRQFVLEMNDRLAEKKFEEMLKLFDSGSETIHRSKKIHYLRLIAAEQISGESYRQALDDFRKEFPADSSIEFYALNYFQKQKDFSEVVKISQKLAELIGDPYLKAFQVEALVQENRLDEANKLVDKMLQAIPGSPELMIHAVNVAVAQRDYGAAVKWLDNLIEMGDVRIQALETLPRYADLLKSSEYEKWIAENGRENVQGTNPK